MIPQPEPLKHGRDGRCEICGGRGPLGEITLPSRRYPIMVCAACYRKLQLRKLFDEDDFKDKWSAESGNAEEEDYEGYELQVKHTWNGHFETHGSPDEFNSLEHAESDFYNEYHLHPESRLIRVDKEGNMIEEIHHQENWDEWYSDYHPQGDDMEDGINPTFEEWLGIFDFNAEDWVCSCEEGEDCEDTCTVCENCGIRTITAHTPFADEEDWPNREERVKAAKGKYTWYEDKGCDYCGEWIPEEAGWKHDLEGVFVPRIEMKSFKSAESGNADEKELCGVGTTSGDSCKNTVKSDGLCHIHVKKYGTKENALAAIKEKVWKKKHQRLLKKEQIKKSKEETKKREEKLAKGGIEKPKADPKKRQKETIDLLAWASKQDWAAEDRPRDQKGRLVPKFGVTKWGNDYWGYGVTYQEWKYKHPASVRVFAEGYGVDLRNLSPEQKEWLEMRYQEDIDSKTALIALIDEFNLSARGLRRFRAEDRPEEERMTRPQAEALSTKMIGLLQPSCEFIEICGSFRRGREDPGDLDIVVILKPRETLPKIVEDLAGEYTAVNWVGEKKTQIIVDGVKVDIRVTTERAKGAALLYFTGPAGYNIGIRRAAKSRGMKLNEYGIFDRETNEYLGGATEEEIYAILGKNFRPATERRAEDSSTPYFRGPMTGKRTKEELEKDVRGHKGSIGRAIAREKLSDCPLCNRKMVGMYYACSQCRRLPISKMTIAELKFHLQLLGISTKGKKAQLEEKLKQYREDQRDEIWAMDKRDLRHWYENSDNPVLENIIFEEEDVRRVIPLINYQDYHWFSTEGIKQHQREEGQDTLAERIELFIYAYVTIWYSAGEFHINIVSKDGEWDEWSGEAEYVKGDTRYTPQLPEGREEYIEVKAPICPEESLGSREDYTLYPVGVYLKNPSDGTNVKFLELAAFTKVWGNNQSVEIVIKDSNQEVGMIGLDMVIGRDWEAEEFRSAVIFPDTYKTAGPLEKAVINNVMMNEIRLQEALLHLESSIKMGLLTEEQAMKAFLEITRYG